MDHILIHIRKHSRAAHHTQTHTMRELATDQDLAGSNTPIIQTYKKKQKQQ